MSDENSQSCADKFDIRNVISDERWLQELSPDEKELFHQTYTPTGNKEEPPKCTACKRAYTDSTQVNGIYF